MIKKQGGRTKLAHIAIEGMDGVGKTTTCKLLAERLGYKFIEKICVSCLMKTIVLTTILESVIK